MSKTLFVGIDVSSSPCEVALLNDDGTQLGCSFSVPNNLQGASKLAEMLCITAQAHQLSQVKIGLESTLVHSWHLRDYFLLTTTP